MPKFTFIVEGLRLAAKYIVEIVMIISGVWGVAANFTSFQAVKAAPSFGIFLATLIITITRLKKTADDSVEQSKKAADALEELTNHIQDLETEAKSKISQRALNKTSAIKKVPHVFAGHTIADASYRHTNEFVGDLVGVYKRNRSEIKIDEHFVINEWLAKLSSCLENGSVWMGITHLDSGWTEGGADPGFLNFSQTLENRSKKKQLIILRLYCLREMKALEELKKHFLEVKKSGIVARYCIVPNVANAPPDITILWSKPRDFLDRRSTNSPAATIAGRSALPLCAMEFTTRHGRSVSEVRVHDGKSDEFDKLKAIYDDAWSKGRSLS